MFGFDKNIKVYINKKELNDLCARIYHTPHWHKSRGEECPLEETLLEAILPNGDKLRCDIVVMMNEMTMDERYHLHTILTASDGRIIDEKTEMIFAIRHFLEMLNDISVMNGRRISMLIKDGNDVTSLSKILSENKCVYGIPNEMNTTIIIGKTTIDTMCNLIDYDIGDYEDTVNLYDAFFDDGTEMHCSLRFIGSTWRIFYEYERDGLIGGLEFEVKDSATMIEHFTEAKFTLENCIYRLNFVININGNLVPAKKFLTDKKKKVRSFISKLFTHSLLCTTVVWLVNLWGARRIEDNLGKILWGSISASCLLVLAFATFAKVFLDITKRFATNKLLVQCGIKERLGKKIFKAMLLIFPILVTSVLALDIVSALWISSKIIHTISTALYIAVPIIGIFLIIIAIKTLKLGNKKNSKE